MTTGNASNGEISAAQLGKILYLFSLGSAALIVPTAVVSISRHDGWITMLFIIPIQMLFLYIYLRLAKRFPRLTLAQYAEVVAGKWLGKAISVSFIFFYLLLSTLILRNMADFMGKSVLPRTPDWFLSATFMIVIAYGAYLGLETIARTGEVLYGWSLFVILIIALALLNQVDVHNFKPLLACGLAQPLKGLYPLLGFPLAESVCLTALLPLVKDEERDKLTRKLGLAAVLTGLVSVLILVMLIGVLGVSETMRSPFAVYEMAKSINIEEILVRVEILFAMVWIGTVFMKLAISVYALVVMTAQTAGLVAYRPLVFPFAVLILPMSIIIYRNSVHASVFAMDVWTVYSVAQGVIVPLLLLLLAAARGKRSNRDGRFPPLSTAQFARRNEGDSAGGEGGSAERGAAGDAGAGAASQGERKPEESAADGSGQQGSAGAGGHAGADGEGGQAN